MAQGKIWATEGVELMFQNIFSQTDVEDLEIITFSNDYTPTVTCTNTNLTEIVENGFEKQDLDTADWVISISGADILATFNVGVGVVWTATADQNVYGIAIRGKTSNKIYYVKNFGLKALLVTNDLTLQPFVLKNTISVS